MKKKITYSIFFVIFIFLLFSNIDDNYFFNRSICTEKQEKIEMKWLGIIKGIYIDSSNHNFNTFDIYDLELKNIQKIYIINESGGFYNNLAIGDTISKNPGNLIVKNVTKKWVDTLNYNCKE